ncbi:MAG: hypothetical protein SPI30_07200 [Prevotella sp.]|nr:hypothetical protein [Prevotella sp.]
MASRWVVVFYESIASYAKGKQQRRCRQTDESSRETIPLARNVTSVV